MTSLAFILGVVPLMVSQGAGAEMRKALGVAVFSGMLGVTLFGLALTPVFFATIDHISETSLFKSSFLRRIGDVVIGIISLRPLRRLASPLMSRMFDRASSTSKPSSPGKGSP